MVSAVSNKKIKKLKKKLRKAESIQSDVVVACLSMILEFQSMSVSDEDETDVDREMFGAYMFAMEVLMLLGVLEQIDLDKGLG